MPSATFRTEDAGNLEAISYILSDLGLEGVTISDDTAILSGLSTNDQSLGKILAIIVGLAELLGTVSTRRGSSPFQGDHVTLSGSWTWTSGNATITGSGGAALSELNQKEWVTFGGVARKITSIGGNNSITLYKPFPSNQTNVTLLRMSSLAERLSTIVPAGTIRPFAGITVPGGHFACDGNAYNKVTYATLYNALTRADGNFTITIATPGRVTKTGHGYSTGDCVTLTTSGNLPVGLAEFQNFFVIKDDDDHFWLATSYLNALAGTKINTSGSQTGTHSIRYAPWGIAGATTFYVPDMRGIGLVGAGVTTRTDGADAAGNQYTGGLGHYDQDVMFAHWHSINDPSHSHTYHPININPFGGPNQPLSGNAAGDVPQSTDSAATGVTVRAASTDGVHGTPRTGSLTSGPRAGVNFIIKY